MEEVRRLRLEKGWNQTELAYHAKLAPSVISLIETGKRDPNAATLRKLAEALGVSIPDLFRESDAPKARAPSSPEPSAGDGSEEERRLRYLATWADYLNHYCERWEEAIENGSFDRGAVHEFFANVDNLAPSIKQVQRYEREEIPQSEWRKFGGNRMHVRNAAGRLMDVIDDLMAAGTAKFESSELEQARKKREARRAALAPFADDTRHAADS